MVNAEGGNQKLQMTLVRSWSHFVNYFDLTTVQEMVVHTPNVMSHNIPWTWDGRRYRSTSLSIPISYSVLRPHPEIRLLSKLTVKATCATMQLHIKVNAQTKSSNLNSRTLSHSHTVKTSMILSGPWTDHLRMRSRPLLIELVLLSRSS